MTPVFRNLILTTLLVTTGLAHAGPRGYEPYRDHHHHEGSGFGALIVGLALAVPLIALANQVDRAPDVVYAPPPPPAPVPVYAPPPVYTPAPVTPTSRPAPVIYPRNGQSNALLESDHRDCNRWATTQPAALADASVFARAVDACMDARGYTLR